MHTFWPISWWISGDRDWHIVSRMIWCIFRCWIFLITPFYMKRCSICAEQKFASRTIVLATYYFQKKTPNKGVFLVSALDYLVLINSSIPVPFIEILIVVNCGNWETTFLSCSDTLGASQAPHNINVPLKATCAPVAVVVSDWRVIPVGGRAVSSVPLLVCANNSVYIQLRRPCQLVIAPGTATGTVTKLSLQPISIPETPPSSYMT